MCNIKTNKIPQALVKQIFAVHIGGGIGGDAGPAEPKEQSDPKGKRKADRVV